MNINIEINELKRRQSELEEKYAAILSAMKALDSLFREKSTKRKLADLTAYEESEKIADHVRSTVSRKS